MERKVDIPEVALKAGLEPTAPYQLFDPTSPTERLLYAILFELQKLNTKVEALLHKAPPTIIVEGPAEPAADSRPRNRASRA